MHLQLDFNIPWPLAVQSLLATSDVVSNINLQSIPSLTCMLPMFQSRALLTLVLPVFVLFVIAVLSKWRTPKGIRGFFTPASLVAVSLLYTQLVKYTFMLFACRTLNGEPGKLFLREDLAMICYDDEHLLWALGLGLPALLLWTLGFPIAKICALYLRRYFRTAMAAKAGGEQVENSH